LRYSIYNHQVRLLTLASEKRGGTPDPTLLLEALSHVYWVGGGTCAGKSTVAHRIADQYGLHLYATDDVMAEHSRRSKPEDSPLLHEFIAMEMDDRWVNRSPATMLETFHWFGGEGFNMIIDDLLCMRTDVRVIVEGFRLLPHLVKPILSASNHAVWLLPSPEFREATIERRGGRRSGFLAKTSNPERALQNLLERDRMFTDRLRNQVEHLELRAIEVNTAMNESDSANLVAKIFGL
jgi:2-phosphoglycerate kinase